MKYHKFPTKTRIFKMNVSRVINHLTTNDIPSASRKKIGKKLISLPAKQFQGTAKYPRFLPSGSLLHPFPSSLASYPRIVTHISHSSFRAATSADINVDGSGTPFRSSKTCSSCFATNPQWREQGNVARLLHRLKYSPTSRQAKTNSPLNDPCLRHGLVSLIEYQVIPPCNSSATPAPSGVFPAFFFFPEYVFSRNTWERRLVDAT